MKLVALIAPCVLASSLFASWQMFSDGKDTYLYNTQSGDVYIRYKRGGKNFEDMFVKMPAGVVPSASANAQSALSSTPESSQEKLLKQQQEALQKSQELLRSSIDSTSAIE